MYPSPCNVALAMCRNIINFLSFMELKKLFIESTLRWREMVILVVALLYRVLALLLSLTIWNDKSCLLCRFLELSSILEPGRPPQTDKLAVLGDAIRVVNHLRAESQEFKETNEKLVEEIKSLKVGYIMHHSLWVKSLANLDTCPKSVTSDINTWPLVMCRCFIAGGAITATVLILDFPSLERVSVEVFFLSFQIDYGW